MATEVWRSPVELRHEDGDHFHCIRNSRDAVACLMTSWPATHDATYAAARKTCLMALSDQCSSEEARDAFIVAAATAKLLRD